MTMVRREETPSEVASPGDQAPCRMDDPRVLLFVPDIVRCLRPLSRDCFRPFFFLIYAYAAT
jgi:hypothetical protein